MTPRTAIATAILLLVCFSGTSGRERRVPRSERPPRIGTVDFSGNKTFSRYLLYDRMASTPSRLFNRVTYSKRVLDDDIRVLQSFYRNQGFLEAKVSLYHVRVDSVRRRVAAFIVIEEHERTYVEKVSFGGIAELTQETVTRAVKTANGKPLLSTVVEADARRIVSRYGKSGFLAATVKPAVTYNQQKHQADVHFAVTEGPVAYAGEHSIEGLAKVKPLMVRRELKFKPGDTLTTDKIKSSVDGLYRTGLFTRASVNPQLKDTITGTPVADSVKQIVIKVKENDLFDIGAAIGYGSGDERLRGSFGITYRNLFGRGKRIAFNSSASFAAQKSELVYTDPRFLTLPVRFDLSGQYGHFDEFNALIGGFKSSVSFKSSDRFRHSLRLRFDDVNYLDADTAKPTQSIYVSTSYDSRDDLFSPTKGIYTSVQGEFAGLGGAASNQFLRGILDIRVHVPLWRWAVFGSALRVGYVDEIAGTPSVPKEERFYGGGNSSIRGYRTRMVGPVDSIGVSDGETVYGPRGGRGLIEFHPIEFRYRIYKALHGTAFVDCGNVFESYRDIDIRNFRWSAGAGLGFSLPFGVIRAEIGFPLNGGSTDPTEPPIWPHLDIGYAF